MSQLDTDTTDRTADQRAAEAVVRHHAELSATLAGHVAGLVEAADIGSTRGTWQHRDRLLAWLQAELLPHAAAEEGTLYPTAAAEPAGRLLVDGMVAEHRAITGLVTELTAATTPTGAAAAARALSALFEVHLAKENDLVLPLLLGSGRAALAGLLDGMHALLGDGSPAGGGCGCGGCGCGGGTGRAG